MRVNSSFAGVALVLLTFFFISSSFTKHPGHEARATQVNLMIRQIGHRLLLQAGDSTSRVMPVEEIREGTFLLRFEKKFVFSHDSLMALSQGLLPKTRFPSGYTVTVRDCGNDVIVYGFQLNNTSPDILACGGRHQPPGCYTIEYAFADFDKMIDQRAEAAESKSGAMDLMKGKPKETHPKPGSSNTASELPVMDKRTHDLRSVKGDLPQAAIRPESSPGTSAKSDFRPHIYGGILMLVVITVLFTRFRKMGEPVPGQQEDPPLTPASGPELAELGQFLFDPNQQCLYLGSEVIGLTDKENKVLQLLHHHFGELIPRDTLMQKVWIDEGVMTGRSLDMFISKLRKKLSRDPGLRIGNVHGKGYKLELI